jgi:hypothetical protein
MLVNNYMVYDNLDYFSMGQLQYVTCTAGGTIGGNSVVWNLGTIPNGTIGSVSVVAKVIGTNTTLMHVYNYAGDNTGNLVSNLIWQFTPTATITAPAMTATNTPTATITAPAGTVTATATAALAVVSAVSQSGNCYVAGQNLTITINAIIGSGNIYALVVASSGSLDYSNNAGVPDDCLWGLSGAAGNAPSNTPAWISNAVISTNGYAINYQLVVPVPSSYASSGPKNFYVILGTSGTQLQLGQYYSTPFIQRSMTLNECAAGSVTSTFSVTPTFTGTFTRTATLTFTPTIYNSPLPSKTFTPTLSVTPTFTLTFTNTATLTFTPTFTATPSFTVTISGGSPTSTFSVTPTFTGTGTPTPSFTPTMYYSSVPSKTFTPTFTATVTLTQLAPVFTLVKSANKTTNIGNGDMITFTLHLCNTGGAVSSGAATIVDDWSSSGESWQYDGPYYVGNPVPGISSISYSSSGNNSEVALITFMNPGFAGCVDIPVMMHMISNPVECNWSNTATLGSFNGEPAVISTVSMSNNCQTNTFTPTPTYTPITAPAGNVSIVSPPVSSGGYCYVAGQNLTLSINAKNPTPWANLYALVVASSGALDYSNNAGVADVCLWGLTGATGNSPSNTPPWVSSANIASGGPSGASVTNYQLVVPVPASFASSGPKTFYVIVGTTSSTLTLGQFFTTGYDWQSVTIGECSAGTATCTKTFTPTVNVTATPTCNMTATPVFTVQATYNNGHGANNTVIIDVTSDSDFTVPPVVVVHPYGESLSKPALTLTTVKFPGPPAFYRVIMPQEDGYGDIQSIVVTGTDTCGRTGVSNGTYTKKSITGGRDTWPYHNVFNPDRHERVRIVYNVYGPDMVRIRVYSRSGGMVQNICTCVQDGSRKQDEASWYGMSDDNRAVVSGVYYVVIETSYYTSRIKVAVVR